MVRVLGKGGKERVIRSTERADALRAVPQGPPGARHAAQQMRADLGAAGQGRLPSPRRAGQPRQPAVPELFAAGG